MTVGTRLLGVDYGTVRIGLAITGLDGKLAFPWATYTRRNSEQDARYFRELVQNESIERIVIGLPILLDGHEGSKAQEARAFGQWLSEVTARPVLFWDERFTTVEAEDLLWSAGLTHRRRKARRDRVAAQIMLQSYLEAGCPDELSSPGVPERRRYPEES
ncbi:MAG TPA: Holliday junction resolvase RuvX [Gemmataceae bacterium]|nr:Holliday junction resolvase RuvX [Gemmataceae bacterium]